LVVGPVVEVDEHVALELEVAPRVVHEAAAARPTRTPDSAYAARIVATGRAALGS
jgi:hypothetical protein